VKWISQFGAALELALLRGPWNSEIQMMTIRIGFASWQILTPELQDQFKRAIYNQAHWKLAQQKAQLALMVKAFNRPELACLLEHPARRPARRLNRCGGDASLCRLCEIQARARIALMVMALAGICMLKSTVLWISSQHRARLTPNAVPRIKGSLRRRRAERAWNLQGQSTSPPRPIQYARFRKDLK
jgi:hypothetical protein